MIQEKIHPNADEALLMASEEIQAGIRDLLNSVKALLHKIG